MSRAASEPTMPEPPPLETMAFDPAAATLIGRGASAEVFALDRGRALKLMHLGVPAGAARREYAATRTAFEAGVPVPAPVGLVGVGDRPGLILARLGEPRWLHRVRRWPGFVMMTLADMARQQAALHRVAAPTGALPHAHDVLAARIAASAAGSRAVAAATSALSRLPRGDRLGHGDLHLGNVMTTRGGVVLIDWAQAMTGDPAADVARSELVMRFGRYRGPRYRHDWSLAARGAAAAWYLACYRRESGMTDAAIDAWRLPVAVAWLRTGSAADRPALQAYVDRRLDGKPRRPSLPIRSGRIQFR